MNWKTKANARRAVSACGNYAIEWSTTETVTSYIALYIANGQSIRIGFGESKEFVKYLCEQHAISVRRAVPRETQP